MLAPQNAVAASADADCASESARSLAVTFASARLAAVSPSLPPHAARTRTAGTSHAMGRLSSHVLLLVGDRSRDVYRPGDAGCPRVADSSAEIAARSRDTSTAPDSARGTDPLSRPPHRIAQRDRTSPACLIAGRGRQFGEAILDRGHPRLSDAPAATDPRS